MTWKHGYFGNRRSLAEDGRERRTEHFIAIQLRGAGRMRLGATVYLF